LYFVYAHKKELGRLLFHNNTFLIAASRSFTPRLLLYHAEKFDKTGSVFIDKAGFEREKERYVYLFSTLDRNEFL